jgi:hypothetical protein
MGVRLLGHIFQQNFALTSHLDGFTNIHIGVELFIPLGVGQTVILE